ncbi:MAG: GNAT family N-acetyltransferase [Planctomycetes bacterium]|nr:GNAT family N-acetyltransferase [Planctomycetota bacterium]
MAGEVPDRSPEPATAGAQARPLPQRPVGGRVLPLPGGGFLDLHRSRWAGVLSAAEILACEAANVPLAYDCAQLGWVPAGCRDEEPGLAGPVGEARDPTPLAAGQRLVESLRSRIGRWAAAPATVPIQTLRREILAAIAAHADAHGVRAADDCHLALASALAAAEAGPAVSPAAAPFTFRRWQPADAPRYRALLDDPQLWAFLPEPYPAPVTEELARQLIALGSIDDRQETLAVEWDGLPVGQCMLRFAEQRHGVRCAEVAYWLAPEHWGKGWMTQILGQFLLRAFRTHGQDLVYAWIHERHVASARVASRCRFRRDGFPRETELAEALKKPSFRRHLTHRCDWLPIP